MAEKRSDAQPVSRAVVLPALVSGVVSAVVAVTLSFVTWRLEIARWDRERAYSAQKELFAKRTELIERTVKLFGQIPNAAALKAAANYAVCEGMKSSPTKRPSPDTATAALQNTMTMQNMQAEIAAVLQLDVIYFGPKTERAVKSLSEHLATTKPWWSVPAGDLQAVLTALGAELFTDPAWPTQTARP